MFSHIMEMNQALNREYVRDHAKWRIALVGNPNVGKSTVFNALTGMHQHTGNWPGKTVALASGTYWYQNELYEMIDLPGTYSLLAHSQEEQVTSDFVCFEHCDCCVVVCDSTCLQRNLHLVLQTLEITDRVVVVANLCDEAKKKQIVVDQAVLSKLLHTEVVLMSARSQRGLEEFKAAVARCIHGKDTEKHPVVRYRKEIEDAISAITLTMGTCRLDPRFTAIKLLEGDERFFAYVEHQKQAESVVKEQRERLIAAGIGEHLEDEITAAIAQRSAQIAAAGVTYEQERYYERDRRIDRIITHKVWGWLLMIALMALIFWITISGANAPSALLSKGFALLEERLNTWLLALGVHEVIRSFVMDGVYKTLTWVVAVMLPPMAIFFPLFTILEDFGYLPRIAFNLDGFFRKARACGKQALTMCMGFGCNAVGVSGARIIDAPRERLIAILTNCFVPCNGRFPTLIAIISMFFAGMLASPWNNIASALLLTGIILLGILLTFWISRLLSVTLCKGEPSGFTLELPPYRRPQFGKVIVRSIFDRTLFVLGRAVCVAIPAGALIWFFANTQVNGQTLLAIIASFLDPFAKQLGLDGVILLAFLLGFPANEIVVPIIIMAYLSSASMVEMDNLVILKELLVANGWTWVTAICTMLFSLIHFPCATTVWTIKKETGSWKWTILSILIPTMTGIAVCFVVAHVALWFA